jgi:glycerol-3-phosphate acyltransferase PlsY
VSGSGTWWLGASLLAAAAGYLAGSIPFGLVLTRLAGLGDVRAIGSGNIGATNVLRTGRKGLALLTLLLDGGKGAAAAFAFAWLWGGEAGRALGLVAGLGAVVGHDFPAWLRFQGGKGVATSLGVLLAAAWPVGALACLTWLAVAGLFRYSSLAALSALGAAPFYAWYLVPGPVVPLAAVLAALAVVRHRANIGRLARGEEPKIGKNDAAEAGSGVAPTDRE